MSTSSTVAEVVSGYADHLRSRDVSEHTGRAHVADVSDFLANAAASFVTDAVIPVDRGMTVGADAIGLSQQQERL